MPRALASGLKPVYLIVGEEPFTALEAADEVRAAARASGFDERLPLFVEAGFRWAELASEGASRSLFAEKRLIDLKMPGGRPGREGSRALVEFARRPPADTLLLVTAMNADWKTARAAWAKALASAGALVECKPVAAASMPHWVASRLESRRLAAPAGAAELIAEYAQGNLLAAAQAIERLMLVSEHAALKLDDVQAALVDESRFGLFELVDAALAGDRGRTLHMLARLRETGTAEPLLFGRWRASCARWKPSPGRRKKAVRVRAYFPPLGAGW